MASKSADGRDTAHCAGCSCCPVFWSSCWLSFPFHLCPCFLLSDFSRLACSFAVLRVTCLLVVFRRASICRTHPHDAGVASGYCRSGHYRHNFRRVRRTFRRRAQNGVTAGFTRGTPPSVFADRGRVLVRPDKASRYHHLGNRAPPPLRARFAPAEAASKRLSCQRAG